MIDRKTNELLSFSILFGKLVSWVGIRLRILDMGLWTIKGYMQKTNPSRNNSGSF